MAQFLRRGAAAVRNFSRRHFCSAVVVSRPCLSWVFIVFCRTLATASFNGHYNEAASLFRDRAVGSSSRYQLPSSFDSSR